MSSLLFSRRLLVFAVIVAAGAVFASWVLSESALRATGLLAFHPEFYHPPATNKSYFEGWYFKQVFSSSSQGDIDSGAIAVVPGIFFGNATDSAETHAFVFVNVGGAEDGNHYYRFPASAFEASSPGEDFMVRIGPNVFTKKGIQLDLTPKYGDDASLSIQGALKFSDLKPWPVSLGSLGAMGGVGWLPFLECRHGVLSFDHTVKGELRMSSGDGETVSHTFDGDEGYIEKDRGSKFPSTWVWLQTNSMQMHAHTSIFFSVARIPFLGMQLPGFTAAVSHGGELHVFASYSGARFEKLEITDDFVSVRLRGSGYVLDLKADRRVPHALLYGPVDGIAMVPSVEEALSATIHAVLTRASDQAVIFDDVGANAGLEVHGDVEWLADNICGQKLARWPICL